MFTTNTIKTLSFPYLLGLFETDGSFTVIFKKDKTMPIGYRLQPQIQWSQNDIDLLSSVVKTLDDFGLTSRVYREESQTRGGRAPCVRIKLDRQERFFERCKLLGMDDF